MTEPDFENSDLPPSRRDRNSLERIVQQQGVMLRSLSQGMVQGRFVPARPVISVTSDMQADDDLAEGVEEDNSVPAWEWNDRFIATGGGTQTANLTYSPIDESLFVLWHPDGRGGIPLTNEWFSVSGNVVTITPPLGGILVAGDEFSFQYQYLPGEVLGAEGSLYNAAVLSRSTLLGFWPMNEEPGATVMLDISGNGRHGTYTPDVILGANALLVDDPDTSANFDPSGTPVGEVPFGSWMNSPTWSVDVWGATAAISSGILTFASRDNDFRSWFIQQTSGGGLRTVQVHGGSADHSVGASLDDTTEHMVSVTYDGSNIRQYIDGALVDTFAATGDMSTSSKLSFGAGWYGSTDYWPFYYYKGRLGKAAYYSGAEPLSEINRRWVIGSTGVDPG